MSIACGEPLTALRKIKEEAATVCPTYEICDHSVCKANYTCWIIADEALKNYKRKLVMEKHLVSAFPKGHKQQRFYETTTRIVPSQKIGKERT